MSIRPEDIPSEEESRAVREAASAPRRSRWRWPVRIVGAVVLLLALVVVLLPTLLSSGVGTRWTLDLMNQRIPGRVEAADLRLSWIKGQQLQGLRLLDPQGETVAVIDHVGLPDIGLIDLLRAKSDIGAVVIEDGQVQLVQDEHGRVNLDRALGTSWFGSGPQEQEPRDEPGRDEPRPQPDEDHRSEEGGGVLPPDLSLQFALRNLRVTMVGPEIEPIELELPEATLTANGPTKLGLTLAAFVAQGQDRGQVKLAGTAANLFNASGELDLSAASFDVDGNIAGLPLTAVDRLAATRGKLVTVLGPMLDAELLLKGKLSEMRALAHATSENLKLRIKLTATPDSIEATEGFDSSLQIRPEAWQALLGEAAPRLIEPFTVVFGVETLDAPRQGTSLDLAHTAYGLTVQLAEGQRIACEVPDRGKVWARPILRLVSGQADDHAELQLESSLSAFGRSGELVSGVRVSRGELGWAAASIEGSIDRLPMPVLDAVLRQGERLTRTFGPTMSMQLSARADGRGGYALRTDFNGEPASAESSNLHGTMSGSYSPEGTITLRTDETLGLDVTPEAFAQWMKPVAEAADMGDSVGIELPEPTTLTAEIDLSLAFRDPPGLRFDPDRTHLSATVQAPQTQLNDLWYHRRFPVSNAIFKVAAADPREPVEIQASFETPGTATESDGEATRPGRFSADATLTGLMLDDGYIQLQRGRVTSQIEMRDLPTVVFDAAARQQGYAVAAFGEKLSATVELDDWNWAEGGPISFELEGGNGSMASFSGRDDGQFFVPDKPMTFHLNQTPALAGRIMRWVNPVLLPAVRSANIPFTVTIDDDTFRLPTRNFAIALLDADVQVQMGTVVIDPAIAPVNKIIQPLQRMNVLSERTQYDARVSPIELRIRDGVFSYDKLTFDIDDIDLQFGGTISFVDESVDMTLTLAGREIDRDPLLQSLAKGGVSIGGTVSEPKVSMDSLLSGFSKQNLPRTIGDVLGGLLKREMQKRSPDEAEDPESE